MRHVEKDVMLRMLDQHWREHLAAMDYLRQGIHLRGYAQKDYRFEYKREAFELFAAMLDRVKFETVSILTKIEVRTQEEIDREEAEEEQQQRADARAAGAARRGCSRCCPATCSNRQPAAGAAAAQPAARAGVGGASGRHRRSRRRRARSCAPSARSVATSPVRAAPVRSSSTATARCRAWNELVA